MAEPKKEGVVTGTLSQIFLSSNSRKILTYYGGYCCLFLFSYVALVSTVSFFHFLLDHEMSVIEAWISRSSWEILAIAKLIALTLSLYTIRLNNYQLKDARALLKNARFAPSPKAVAISVFIICFFAALAFQFEGAFHVNELSERFGASFIGSCAFYLFDLFVIFSLIQNFGLEKKRHMFMLGAALPSAFLVSSKMALPYIDHRSLFLVLNFLSLSALLIKEKNNLGNILIYSIIVIGPLACLFGADLTWEDDFSYYLYPERTPAIGIIAIWLTAFLYYLRTNRPA